MSDTIEGNDDKEEYALLLDSLNEERTDVAHEIGYPEAAAISHLVPWRGGVEKVRGVALRLRRTDLACSLLIIGKANTIIPVSGCVFAAFEDGLPFFAAANCSPRQRIWLGQYAYADRRVSITDNEMKVDVATYQSSALSLDQRLLQVLQPASSQYHL